MSTSSAAITATSSSSSTIFTGTSRYSTDFQSVITRAVDIASLPITQLQNEETVMNNQSTALTDLQTKFTALQTAITNLASAGGASSFTSTSTDTSVATATVTDSALAGEYTIDVLDPGSYAVTVSKDGLGTVTDPSKSNLASGTSFSLTINGQEHDITSTADNMSSLAQAINSAGLGVRATIVNVGSSSTPDYRLSVQGDHYENMSIQLSASGQDLLQSVSAGASVQYRVNGVPSTAISSGSRDVTLAPGVTASLSTIGSTTVDIAQGTSSTKDALSAFATAYNTIVDALDQQRGSNNGALAGQSILLTLTDSLRGMAGYDGGTGSLTSLSSLGLSLGEDGHLTFSSTDFDTATSSNAQAAFTFLGSTTGSGFLKFAQDALTAVNDATNGSLTNAISNLKTQITEQDAKISDQQTRVDDLKQTLTDQMSAADASIASLEQQVTYLTSLFETTNTLSKEYTS